MKKYLSSVKKYFPFFLCLITFVCLTCFLFSEKNQKNSTEQFKDFDAFTEHLFQESVTANTINLHYTLSNPAMYGITKYKPTLGTISEEGQEKSIANLENTKKALNSFSYDSLSTRNQMTYDILSDFIEQELSASSYYYYNEFLRSLYQL